MDSTTSSAYDTPSPFPAALQRTSLHGMSALTDAELLTLVLSARRSRSEGTSRAAERLARVAGSLRRLARWTLPEIAGVPGIGERRAIAMLAAIELGRRTALEKIEPGAMLASPSQLYRHYRAALRDERREIFLVGLLDTKLRWIRDARISEGSLDATVVHPREAFAPAIREPAHAVVFVHNHPSGDPAPSPEDQALTKRLVACGDILGIRVVDHLVLGEDTWFSFADAGHLRGNES